PSLTYFSTSQKEQVDIKDAEIVFVGYAVEAAEYNWDDFKGADLNGKIMLILNNDPQIMNGDQLDENYFKGETRTYYGRYTYKFEQAMRKGAAGAILIHTTRSAGYPFRVLQGSGKNTSYAIDIEGSGYQLDFVSHLDSLTSDKIARKMGKSLPELFQMALDPNFKPVSTGLKLSAHIETALSEVKTSNLFAKIEGSDPDLKSQHILFSAHYDHLGMNHTDTEGDDEIFNGAWDNASGSASLLSLAEAFTKVKPKRSIIILHCAAEESGLLGSEYFVKRPPLPLNQIVADINIDMPNIYGISSDMAVIGVNSNSMGDELKRFAKSVMVDEKQSLRITDDPDPNAGLFYRSDQVHFAKAGIPAIYIESGRKFIGKPDDFYERKNEEVYHRVTDQIDDDWDLNGLERDLRLIFRTIISVANSTEQPKWHSGNEFESAYKNLYK
ncbi:MAG: M28 family peptidase, partial [Calditrichaeota bacterium]|nr:M28 family peptidase [Calditrichota bacterium]